MNSKVISREQRAKWTMLSSLLTQIVAIICGFVIPRLLITCFGAESYGATASISQFLGYISLLEGGISGVARAALYKPLANKDFDTTSQVLNEIKKFFRIIGLVFVGYVVVIACSFKVLSHNTTFDWAFCFWLVIVISISTFAQYFIGISYSVFLLAAQKGYIISVASILTIIFNTVCIIVLANCGFNLIVVKLVSSIVFILKPIILWMYVKRHYTFSNKSGTGTNEKILTQKWVGLGQHIAYYLHSNTDAAVLTIFGSLTLVAIYSIYNMVTSNIQNMIASASAGMEALFGDMIAKNEYEQLKKSFSYYETLLSYITIVLFSTTAVMIIPFVQLYTAGLTDANYIKPVFAILLVLAAAVYCIRLPYHSIVIAAGHFKQTSVAAYGEAVINIFFSILLVNYCGIIGVAIGTLLAVIFRYIFYAAYLTKHILKRSIYICIMRVMFNSLNFIIVYIFGKCVINIIDCNGYLIWVLTAAIVFGISIIVTTILNLIFFKDDCRLIYINFVKGKAMRNP